MRVQAVLSFMIALSAASAQTNPVKMAVLGRFDLLGNSSVGSLTNGYMLAGDASVDRQTWLTAAEQPRSYTINCTISHFGWTEASFRFVPASNGTVTLTLRGPWEQSPNSGPIYRQEVFWDAASATNTTVPNGSFETVSGGVPTGWSRPYGDASVFTGPPEPLNGVRYVRTWHDGPLNCTLSVTGGLPVSLKFFGRAAVPTNFTEMARVSGTNTPAHLAARKFMRGVNLGNYLEAPPGQDWGAHYTGNDFVNIRNEGFDHVRLPVAWHYYTSAGPTYTISNSFFPKVDFLVTNALNRGLGVLLNIHHFDAFVSDPASNSNKFYAIWQQIAAYYSNAPPQLAFELLNEPNGAASTAVLNPIYAEAIRLIRLTNPNRQVFVGPSQWNSIPELSNLRLPDNDTNLIVTVHCYDPFLFTHQGATWAGSDPATTGVLFPGPPQVPLTPAPGISSWASNFIASYNSIPSEGNPSSPLAFRAKLQFARQWSDYYGRPVHVGEFGAYTVAEPVSRARFYSEFRSIADSLGLGWAMWDWKAGFRYWDDGTGQPAPGLRGAMFPAPRVTLSSPAVIEINEAIGKTFRLDRTLSLSPASWVPLQTQTFASTKWVFNDSASSQNAAAFYRAVWLK
jgi:endoglucanase